MTTTNQPGSFLDGVLRKSSTKRWNRNPYNVQFPDSLNSGTGKSGTGSTLKLTDRSFQGSVGMIQSSASPKGVTQVRYRTRSLSLFILNDQCLEPPKPKISEVERRFKQLASQWIAETVMLSALSQKVLHPAYQQIIGMGDKVLPYLFQELAREPNHWFWALKAITGANPIKPENRGRIRKMAEDWLAWGRDRGYCK